VRDLMRLFGWSPKDTEEAVARLTQSGTINCGLAVEGQPGEWVALAGL
jgi:hypothetical protein